MRALPWYKRHVSDWRSGTRGMSMEMRGFYSECLDAMWDRQGGLPNDVQKLSVMLDCNPRTVRKLLPQLVAMGKLVLTKTGYLNERMSGDIGVACDPVDGELEPKSTQVRRQIEPNSTRIRSEFEPKNENSPTFSTRDLEAKKLEEDIVVEGACARPGWKDLEKQLLDAAGNSIASQAIAPGLAMISPAFRWLDGGCDLQLDVLPTIRLIAAKPRRKPIVSWEFFTQAVVDAKAARLAPLPAARAPQAAEAPRPQHRNPAMQATIDLVAKINAEVEAAKAAGTYQ